MGENRYIVAGGLIDGGGEVRKNVCLAVRDGNIAAIVPAAGFVPEAGALVDDFSHCLILPALVDCSVSLARSPSVDPRMQLAPEAALAEKLALVGKHIAYCHGHGVLGLVDGDGEDLGESDDQPGERSEVVIRTAGRRWQGEPGDAGGAAVGDFIKIAYSSAIADQEALAPALDYDDLRRLLQQRRGKKAVVLANGERPVAEAIAAGCDAIEQGYGMGEENLRMMAAKGIMWIPSVLQAKNALDGSGSGGDVCCRFSLRYVAPGTATVGGEALWRKVLADQLAQLRTARALGVTTAVGTGAGTMGILHGESVAEEMKLFIKAGYPLAEAVRCASENGARFFGMTGLGRLMAGSRATFVIARGTLAQLPRKLSYLEGIYINGAPSAIYRKNPRKGA